jgi:hypothetical protein
MAPKRRRFEVAITVEITTNDALRFWTHQYMWNHIVYMRRCILFSLQAISVDHDSVWICSTLNMTIHLWVLTVHFLVLILPAFKHLSIMRCRITQIKYNTPAVQTRRQILYNIFPRPTTNNDLTFTVPPGLYDIALAAISVPSDVKYYSKFVHSAAIYRRA